VRKRASCKGEPVDDLAELFRAINHPSPPDPAEAADGAGKAELLAAVASGEIFGAGADNLRRIGEAVAAGWLDDGPVTDEVRKKVIDHVGQRLRAGDPAECAAARAALGAILQRPGAQVTPPEAAAGGPAPLHPEDNGDPPGAEPRPPGGRTRRGRFAAGNTLGRGNPAHRKCAALRAALGQDLGEGEMRQLGLKLYQQALSGDTVAARLLLEYLIGRPRLAPDPDALDLMEWKLLTGGPTVAALWHAAHEVADPTFACEVWRRLSAASADAATDQLVDAVQREPGRFARDLAAERRAKVGR
jgi:hypothetical protein